jgi:hypothetical protein
LRGGGSVHLMVLALMFPVTRSLFHDIGFVVVAR